MVATYAAALALTSAGAIAVAAHAPIAHRRDTRARTLNADVTATASAKSATASAKSAIAAVRDTEQTIAAARKSEKNAINASEH